MVGVEYTSHAALLPRLMGAYGFGPVGAAVLSGCFIATLALVSFPAGHLVDRFGTRLVGLVGLAGIVLGNLAFAAAQGLGSLVVAKCLGGVGGSMAFIAGVRHANVVLHGRRSFWVQGVFGGSTQLGAASGLYLAAVLGERFGWRAAYLAAAVTAAAIAGLWFGAGRPDGRGRLDGSRRGSAASVVANRAVWLLAIAYTEMFGLAFVLGNWTSVLLRRELDVSLVVAGAAGATFLLVGIVARPVGGVLLALDLLRPRALMALSLAASAAALAALTMRRASLGEVVALLVVAGIGANVPYAAVMVSLNRLVPDNPATAVGVATTITLALMAVETFCLGWLIPASAGPTRAFGFLFLAVVGGLVAVALLPREGASANVAS